MSTFTDMVVALDGSPPSQAAFEAACSLARDRGGRITAVSVCEPQAVLRGRHVAWNGADSETRRESIATLRRASESAAERFGLTIETKMLDGDIVSRIVAYARHIGADSIVVGSHGRGGLERILLGSVAEGIMRASTVPVLVVHPPAAQPVSDVPPAGATTNADASR